MTTVPAWDCMCGDRLDEDGDCPRCTLELDECDRCQALLGGSGLCYFCDSHLVWTEEPRFRRIDSRGSR